MGTEPSTRKLSWPMALFFVLLLLAMLLVNRLSEETERQSLLQVTRERLDSIANLTLRQIGSWLSERQMDATLLAGNPFFRIQVEQALGALPISTARRDLDAALGELRQEGHYQQVILFSTQGDPLFTALGEAGPVSPQVAGWVAQAAEEQSIVFSDLYLDPEASSVWLDYYIPIASARQPGRAAAVLMLRIDPTQTLFPLIEDPAGTENTTETYLIRSDGSDTLYLSDLRYHPGAPLRLRASQDQVGPRPIATPAQPGSGEIVEGVDYRGVPALAAIHPVPSTSWTLVTKVDRQEVEAALIERAHNRLFLTALILLAFGMVGLLVWRHREMTFYKERYRAEAARKVLDEQLTTLTKYANDMILLMDTDWRILEANDRALANYGYTAEEMRNISMRQLQFEASQADLVWQSEAMANQDGVVFETTHRRKDMSTFPVEVSSRMIHAGEQVFYQSIIRDITERRKAEQELRESERRFRAFYEQAPVGYQLLDQEGRFTEVNRAWLKMTGYPLREVLGRFFGEFLAPISQEQFERVFEDLKATGELSGEEFELVTKEGSRVAVALYGKATYDSLGHIKQIHCILHDITDQRQAKEKIHRLNEELEQRVLERTSQLEAANRELEAFSYSVSHDLRAPLRAIDGFSRILVDEYQERLDPDAKHYLERVQENTRTMSNLIDSLLAFSRLSRQPLKKETIDPTLLVQQALVMLVGEQPDPKLCINLQKLTPCQADPALLKQVFINLLSNAIKFSSKCERPVVEIGCLENDGEVIYYVKDNGVGFDMAYANKLFGVFQRLHRSEDFEGTGVGLANVQRIIHRHGGRIWAMSEPGQGATFCFTLEDKHASN